MFTDENCTAIQDGAVGVVPSETVYGIVCSALNEEAILRVYRLKSRDEDRQVIVLISNPDQLDQFGVSQHDKERMIELWQEDRPTSIDVFVPEGAHGRLTLGKGTIAFRLVKGFEELKSFIDCTGPIIAPSANPQLQPPATNIAMAKEYFGDSVDFYVDGGDREAAPSRVIRLEKDGTIWVKRS